MKLRQILMAAAFSVVAVNTVGASPHTITWSAQNPGAALGDAAGNEMAPGSIVRLGYFAISAAEVTAAFHDVPYLEGQFTEVSREQIGNFGGVVYGEMVEKLGSGLGVPGAFAQTITLESESIPAGKRFYVWISDASEPEAATAQGIFSSASWQLRSDQATVLQWGIESVDPAVTEHVYLAETGSETSPTVGGLLNKLRLIDTNPGPGDLEDPDGNGIVALLEEAFLIEAGTQGHANMPHMAAADVLVYNRKAGGEAVDWDVYRSGDLEYRVEVSNDFLNWQLASDHLEEAGIPTAEAGDAGGERVAVKLPLSPGPKSGTYFRLHVRRITAEEAGI